jgi:hypothetical protein
MDDFYLFITSLDSIENYPDNSYCSTKIDLQEPIELSESDDCYWSVALVDIAISENTMLAKSNVILLCDVVEGSYIRNRVRSVLRIFSGDSATKGSLFMPYYHRVSRNRIRTIHLEFVDLNLKTIQSQGTEPVLACTLHFQNNRRM